MSEIQVQNALPVFNNTMLRVYREMPTPSDFLRSFFRKTVTNSRYLNIEVRRGTERVAVDVPRGTEGNRNQITRSTLKQFEPPYYKEYIDLVSIQLYDRVFGQNGTIDAVMFADFIAMVQDELRPLVDKIHRAQELQAAQVLQTGIVVLVNGDNIDFRRKAGSIVDLGGGNYWNVGSVDPKVSARTGGDFLRTDGLVQTGTFNMILGGEALQELLNNASIQAGLDLKDVNRDSFNAPSDRVLGRGSVLHGQLSAGDYKFNIWTYPEVYELANGSKLPYIDPKNMVILPENTTMELGCAAVPMIRRDPSNAEYSEFLTFGNTEDGFVFGNRVDYMNESHFFDVKNAPLCIPTAVDQIFTAKVVSG